MKMKNHLLFILGFLLITVSANGQDIILKSLNLPTYAGTWQYASKTDTFTLVLKEEKVQTTEYITECLYGLHYYKKNGKVIDNYLGLTPSQSNYTFEATNAAYIKYYNEINPNSLDVTYVDNNKQRDKWMQGSFDLNPNNPKEMTWTLIPNEREGIAVEGYERPPQDMSCTIPTTMVLKKIK